MTEIIYERELHRVAIKGHTAYQTLGQDIVCAGVSALAFTLADRVSAMSAAEQIEDATVFLEPGKTLISCKAYEGTESVITLVFDTICAGFEILAANAPEYVSYKMISSL